MDHIQFYTLQHLCEKLTQDWIGAEWLSCFTLEKSCLGLLFGTKDKDFNLRLDLLSQPLLDFPEHLNKPKNNSTDLFSLFWGEKITQVYPVPFDRSWVIALESVEIWIQMYPRGANVILRKDKKHLYSFKKREHLVWFDLQASVAKKSTWEKFLSCQGALACSFPYHTSHINEKIESQLSLIDTLDEQWTKIQTLLFLWQNTQRFYILEKDHKLIWSLWPEEKIHQEFDDIEKGLHGFYVQSKIYERNLQEKKKQLKLIADQIKKTEKYLYHQRIRKNELSQESAKKIWADHLMSYIGQEYPWQNPYRVPHLYLENTWLDIPVNTKLNAQENATIFYRKAKKEPLELQIIDENIEARTQALETLKQNFTHWETIPLHEITTKTKTVSNVIPVKPTHFHHENFLGYDIYIGRHDKNNDELIKTHHFKNDLWLHAKDVPGSHVMVKFQAGKDIPKAVKMRAAALAAYYSKRKSETVVPVICTERKYVRKVKGMRPGQVKVDQESILLVAPESLG